MKLGDNLNNSFDNVIVRNISESTKRLDNFKITASNINLKYEIYNSIRGDMYIPSDFVVNPTKLYPFPANQYIYGNHLSLLNVHLNSMSKRYSSYVVCDDDTEFYDIQLELIKNYLPNDWDVIIMGNMKKLESIDNEIIYTPTFFKPSVSQIAGSQCAAINSKAYYSILDYMLSYKTHFKTGDAMWDVLSRSNQIKLYMMYPDITHQNRNTLKPYTIE